MMFIKNNVLLLYMFHVELKVFYRISCFYVSHRWCLIYIPFCQRNVQKSSAWVLFFNFFGNIFSVFLRSWGLGRLMTESGRMKVVVDKSYGDPTNDPNMESHGDQVKFTSSYSCVSWAIFTKYSHCCSLMAMHHLNRLFRYLGWLFNLKKRHINFINHMLKLPDSV